MSCPADDGSPPRLTRRPPANPPTPELGKGGVDISCYRGRGDGSLIITSIPFRLRPEKPIRRRCTVSLNASAVAEPALTIPFPSSATVPIEIGFPGPSCTRPVGSKAAVGGRSRQQHCYGKSAAELEVGPPAKRACSERGVIRNLRVTPHHQRSPRRRPVAFGPSDPVPVPPTPRKRQGRNQSNRRHDRSTR